MIYSEEINKICGLCLHAEYTDGSGDDMYCSKRRRNVTAGCEACRKFKYDILKRTARRKRKKLKTYSSSDFELI